MSFKEKKRRGDHSSRYDTSEPLITYRENSNLPQKDGSEDILVMLSDGAFDGFSQNGLEMAARYLKEMDVVRPQAIADGLYEQITTNKEFEKRDDMTIMVLGIWDRY